MDTYSVKQASDLTGISKPALRVYTKRYARWLSSEATPAAGEARTFTADDLRLLKFVYDATQAGAHHQQVVARLDAGELDAYPWQPGQNVASEDESALMPPDQVRLLQSLFDEYRQREDAYRQRETELRDRIEQLQSQLGETRGRLAERGRWQPPAWWRFLFGTRSD